jgi:transcriptional regulator of heat shock response
VRIGHEQQVENLQQTSLVTAGYGIDNSPQGSINALGALGILGPTRMDYASSMATVGAVARYISRYLTEGA